jgi:hypothetical protein
VNGARTLAICGLTASIFSMFGGFFNISEFVGIGGAVMLVGNIVVAFSKDGRAS